MNNTQIAYISHGGGPMPLLKDPNHEDMIANLKLLSQNIMAKGKPSAIVVISAHWETLAPKVTAMPLPTLYYDYYGFPDEAYSLEYPCVGSGSSFHNLDEFFKVNSAEASEKNIAFEHWLADTVMNANYALEERQKILAGWQHAPHAQFCHPREEHLIPLHVCMGLAGRPADKQISMQIMNKQSSFFYWGTSEI